MRTVTTVLGVAGVAAVSFLVVSQLGGLDQQEFAGLMNGPKPEQGRLMPEPELPAEGALPDAGENGVPGPRAPPEAMVETPQPPPERVAPPPSDLVTSAVRSVRNVTAPGMTPAPAVSGPLEREAAPRKPPPPPRWKLFSPVTVRAAGLLGAGPHTIRLAGIVPPAEDRQCRLPSGTGEAGGIACGKLAMVALRNRIRAFGVECRVPASDSSDTPTAPCRIGKTDLSLWMIEQGWAEAASGAPEGYPAAEREARCARRGMWRADDPPPDCLQN